MYRHINPSQSHEAAFGRIDKFVLYSLLWIRIRKDPHHFGNLDLHQIKIRIRFRIRTKIYKLDPDSDPHPDPHQRDADPQHCL